METTEFVNQFQKAWADFKKTNDEILSAKADGKSVGELESKLDSINQDLDKMQEVSNRLNQLETAFRRPGMGGALDAKGLTQDQLEHKGAFMQFFRKGAEDGLAELEKKALSVNDDTSGGYMVHADLSGQIVKRIFETSPIRQYASVATISTDALEGPIDSDQADYGWVAETGVRPQTATPKIGMWRIPTHEMYAMPAATQKLLDDAAWDPETWLADKVADKFARAENNAFVLGDGVGKPFGFLGAGRTIVADSSVTDDSFISGKKLGYIPTGKAGDFVDVPSSGANPAQGDVLITTMHALKSAYREMPGTAWAMHRTTIGRVRRLRDNMGNYLWAPGLGGRPATLLEYPVAEFNDMAQIGANAYGIVFANWKKFYQIVDRVGIRVLRDPYTSKPFILFYTTKRVGGDILNFEAAKIIKFAAT